MGRRGFDFDAEYGAHYDERIRQVFAGYDDLFPSALAHLAGSLGPSASVLVVGCGTGSELVAFARERPGWSLTGVDPSAQMIHQAGARLGEAGVHDRVRLIRGYLEDLPPEPAFDAATLICVMHFMPDGGPKLGLLQAIAARLRPGAPLVLVDGHGDPSSPEFRRDTKAWFEFMIYRGMLPGEQDVYRRQLEESVHWVPEERILALLSEAGFQRPHRFFRNFVFGGWLVERA